MNKVSDRKLSLAVAKIMWPEYEWVNRCGNICYFPEDNRLDWIVFDHTTDDALGKMCVWLTAYLYKQEYEENIDLFKALARIADYLRRNNRHREMAEAIRGLQDE